MQKRPTQSPRNTKFHQRWRPSDGSTMLALWRNPNETLKCVGNPRCILRSQSPQSEPHENADLRREAKHKLNTNWNNNYLEHTDHRIFPGVTLDRTLTDKQHFTKAEAKVHSRNSIIRKLAKSKLGATPSTLSNFVLALCYSVAAYACPVWQHSPHAHNPALNAPCRITTGCLKRKTFFLFFFALYWETRIYIYIWICVYIYIYIPIQRKSHLFFFLSSIPRWTLGHWEAFCFSSSVKVLPLVVTTPLHFYVIARDSLLWGKFSWGWIRITVHRINGQELPLSCFLKRNPFQLDANRTRGATRQHWNTPIFPE